MITLESCFRFQGAEQAAHFGEMTVQVCQVSAFQTQCCTGHISHKGKAVPLSHTAHAPCTGYV